MTDILEATILGCGSSGGVPRLGGLNNAGFWGACDPHNPKNRRTRCSLLARRKSTAGETTVLIDTSPDMRQQLLDGLILEGQFGMVDRLLGQCELISRDGGLPQANREMARTCGDRLFMLMHEGQRVRAIATALNSGRTKDLEGLKRYLLRLGPTVTLLLLDLLDSLNAPQHRRVVADVLAIADGCIVGSSLKIDGDTWKAVDPDRADEFMRIVRQSRGY